MWKYLQICKSLILVPMALKVSEVQKKVPWYLWGPNNPTLRCERSEDLVLHVTNWLTDWLKNRLKCLSCCSQLKISLSATVGRLQRLSQENHQNIKHWERHLWYLYLMYFAGGEKVILPKSLKVCIFISRLLLRRFYLQSYILSWIVLSVWRLTLSSVSRLYKHIVF